MQINISGHHVELTPALKDYITTKFDKLERHFDQITNCQVTLEVEKGRQMAEATLHVSGGEIHAKAENEDMYAAIRLVNQNGTAVIMVSHDLHRAEAECTSILHLK